MLQSGMFIGDRYEIIEKVGAGGMSDVYKAMDHVLSREVAIKILKQEFAEDTTFVTKFRAEAQSAAALEHPNIVNIYDVGSENGMYYIVMEYVEGITLKTYVEKKGQLNFKEVISIAIQVGRGIEAAHNKGIIHRDIKPQNIIISREGKVKVTDFGIARAVSSNTINADVMGSVHYASPEQARNGYVTTQSDIYSLGIVMYEMATGRVPFDGETTVAIAIQHLQSEMVAPSAYAPDLPIAVEKIILKSTTKSPDRRYETIGDMLMDLKKALLSPNEDFVTMVDADFSDKTRVITTDEVEQIKKETAGYAIDDNTLANQLQNQADDEDEYDDDYDDYDDDYDDEEDGDINPKIEKIINITGIAAGVVIIGLLVYLFGSFFGLFKFSAKKGAEVEMINVVGMAEADAESALEELGIATETKEVVSSEAEKGLVLDQSAKAGDIVNTTETITLTVGGGEDADTKDDDSKVEEGDIEVPNIVGMEQESAVNTIEDKGLKYTREYVYDASVAEGKVISQSPAAGKKVAKGTKITITVSQGSESVQIPDVTGMSQTEATEKLKEKGFSVASVSSEYSDNVPTGCVISQTPGASKYAETGSSVSLVVSLGPKSEAALYSCSINVSPQGGSPTRYTLTDANGKVIVSGLSVEFAQVISANNITTATGTLSWENDAGQSGSDTVTFTRQ